MRVILANYTLSMMRGGGETRDLALARELTGLGVEVELLSVKPLFGRARYPVEEAACRYLPSPYFRDLVYRLMQVPKAGRLAAFLLRQDVVQFSRRVVDLLARTDERVDVLQGAGLYPLVEIKRRRAVPVVIRAQGGRPPTYFRQYVPMADAIIGDGSDFEQARERFGREVVEIPGGVDLGLFQRVETDVRARLGLLDREVVLYVGRFAPLKNVSLLLEAFALLRQKRSRAHLILVGEGALEGRLRNEARRLGVAESVVFAGARPLQELPAWYAAADVFALPSSFDNSPNVLLEAMACELPVVATRVGGVPRYVTDGVNGLLVAPDEAASLAAALEALLDQPRLRTRLVAAGLARVRQGHSWAGSARKLLALYETLVPGASTPVLPVRGGREGGTEPAPWQTGSGEADGGTEP